MELTPGAQQRLEELRNSQSADQAHFRSALEESDRVKRATMAALPRLVDTMQEIGHLLREKTTPTLTLYQDEFRNKPFRKGKTHRQVELYKGWPLLRTITSVQSPIDPGPKVESGIGSRSLANDLLIKDEPGVGVYVVTHDGGSPGPSIANFSVGKTYSVGDSENLGGRAIPSRALVVGRSTFYLVAELFSEAEIERAIGEVVFKYGL